MALASVMNPQLFGNEAAPADALKTYGGSLPVLHHPPKAKRIIWLFMADAPSQLDLFDYKPKLQDFFDKDLPDSIRKGQRITTMTRTGPTPCGTVAAKFAQHGKSGAWLSELLPEIAGVVDDLCIVKTMNTEAINHDPAITYIQTGSQIPRSPSTGAWLSYGIGSPNKDLPAFVVLHSKVEKDLQNQALFSRLWGAGFIPSPTSGVALRALGDPVLYLSNPPGVSAETRRRMLDGLAELNQKKFAQAGDPEINSRIAQYEMAYRMQTSVPDLTDISKEPQSVLDLYGPSVEKSRELLLITVSSARRLAERGVPVYPDFPAGLRSSRQSSITNPAVGQNDRPTCGRFDPRSQTAWHAGRYPGDLGR